VYRQPEVTFALKYRLIVNHVVNSLSWWLSIEQQKKRGGNVVPMHLIDEAIVFRIDCRVAGQKFVKQSRPPGPIDSGEARHDAATGKDHLFCFQQDSSSLVGRLGLTLFGYPRSIALRVDARAAGKENCRSNKAID